MRAISHSTYQALHRAFISKDSAEHSRLVLRHARAGSSLGFMFDCFDPQGRWRTFAMAGLKKLFEERQGTVYAAGDTAHPELWKIGQTGLRVEERLKALNSEAVAGELRCAYSLEVHDRHYIEAAAHHALSASRFKKEFFRVTLRQAQIACENAFHDDLRMLAENGLLDALPPRVREMATEYEPSCLGTSG